MGGRDLLKKGGWRRSFDNQLAGASKGLGGHFEGLFVGKAVLLSSSRHRLDKAENKAWAAASDAATDVHEVFRDFDHFPHTGKEDMRKAAELVIGVGAIGKDAHPLANGRGDVGHDPQKGSLRPKIFLIKGQFNPGDDRDNHLGLINFEADHLLEELGGLIGSYADEEDVAGLDDIFQTCGCDPKVLLILPHFISIAANKRDMRAGNQLGPVDGSKDHLSHVSEANKA